MISSKLVLDFNECSDITVDEFDKWFFDKYLTKLKLAEEGESSINYFKDKYNVEWWFHRDTENNQYSIELKLVNVKDYPPDHHLEEMKHLKHDKPEGNGLEKIDGIIDEEILSNRNHIDIDKLRDDLGIEPIPEKDRRDQVRFTKTYY